LHRSGGGFDTLYGGSGNDAFVFNAALGAATNIDTIRDFVAVIDTIYLENSVFTALTATGALAAGAFWKGSAAHDSNDRIIYNPSTGALFYDADGKGGAAAIQFATLSTKPPISARDFVVI
jgi:Ca2+-binding RTX toxin-like protein